MSFPSFSSGGPCVHIIDDVLADFPSSAFSTHGWEIVPIKTPEITNGSVEYEVKWISGDYFMPGLVRGSDYGSNIGYMGNHAIGLAYHHTGLIYYKEAGGFCSKITGLPKFNLGDIIVVRIDIAAGTVFFGRRSESGQVTKLTQQALPRGIRTVLPAVNVRKGGSARLLSFKVHPGLPCSLPPAPSSAPICSVFRYEVRGFIWWDKRTGGKYDGSFWRLSVLTDTLGKPAGNYAASGHPRPRGKVLATIYPDSGHRDMVKHPVGYEHHWHDRGSFGEYDGSYWTAIPPPGYFALGGVFQDGYNAPRLDAVYCVKQEYVVEAEIGEWVWSDQGTGARSTDIGFWRINGGEHGVDLGTFTHSKTHSHDRPTHKVYTIGKQFCHCY